MVFPPFLRLLGIGLLVSYFLVAQSAATLFAATGQGSAAYLPVVAKPPAVSPFQLAKSNTCSNDFSTPVLSPATFAYGIKQLAVSTTIDGGAGLVWRLEWTIDGKHEPSLDKTGTLDQPAQTVSMSVVYGPDGTCSDALPRGVYVVRLLLNGTIFQEATATIQ